MNESYMRLREKPVILAFWHGHQVLMLGVLSELFDPHPKRKTFVLISEHSDGRIIAGAIKPMGLDSVAGSSTKGAKKATLKLLKKLQEGHNIAITPDGPKGPLHRAKLGAVKLSQMSGCPILPMALSASKHWRISSWDRMMFPKPFSRLVYSIGEPIYIPENANEEELKLKSVELTQILNMHAENARRYCELTSRSNQHHSTELRELQRGA